VKRCRHPHKDGSGNHPHGLRVLVGQQGQQGSETAQPSSKEDEKRKLLLRINRNLMKHGKQLPVSTFCAARIWIEQMSLLQWVGKQSEGPLPGAVQQVQSPIHPLPMSEMIECVTDGLTITLRGDRGETGRGARTDPLSVVEGDIEVSRLGTFNPEVEATIKQAMEDPNRLSGRSLMELVRQIFTRVVENQKMAETAARFCISIIEREKKETFLESLLNTCQEWYHDRDHLLRSDSKSGRWSSFMSFLNEMYGLLKRKQLQLMTKYEGIPPKLVLLSLLAECCTVTLKSPSLHSVNEVECLFLVLTHIGRDLLAETPGQMSLILSCLRDAFLSSDAPQQVRKTLLQLIELQAAGWQLPAESVMYYYPGAKV